MKKGFTIVELLVVIVVIGILVTIGIVSYNGIQGKAQDAAVQSDLEGIAGQLEAYRTQQTNISQVFPNTASQLGGMGLTVSKDSYDTSLAVNLVYCTDSTNQEFSLAAVSKSGTIFLMTEDSFRSNTLTKTSFTASLCSTLGLTFVANGYASGAWQI